MKNLFTSMLVLALLSAALTSKSQSILSDAKGEPLFVVPTAQVSIKLSSKVIGFDVPISTIGTKQFYVFPGNDKSKAKINTMIMSKSWYGGLTFIENSKSILSFSSKPNLTPTLEFGFKRTLDELQNPTRKKGVFYTFSAAATAKYQHFTVYDKTSKVILDKEQTRISPGFKAALNIYRGDRYAFAFNGNWQKSINTDKLTSFQKLVAGSYYADGNVASNGTNDGYFAPIDPTHQFRLSAAWSYYGIPAFNLPATSRFSDLNKVQLALSPYYFLTTERFDKVSHNAGIGLSIFPSRVFKTSKAKFSDALTLSYNLVNSADKSKARFLYLSGTFSFGNFKSPRDADEADKAR